MKRYWAAFAIVALASAEAHGAARTVTLLGVSGPGGSKLAGELERDLGDLYEVVSGDVYRAQAAKMGKQGASEAEVQAVATRLHVDAVIGASIVGNGRARRILVAVREGATGRVVARGRYEITTRAALRDRVVADLVRALERTSASRGSAIADGDAANGGGDDGEPSIRRDLAARERPVAGLTVSLGPSLLNRTIAFQGTTTSYDSGTLAGLRVAAALFPFALSSTFAAAHPVVASFGVLASYEHAFGSTAHGDRWNVLLAGRVPLGHHAVAGYLQVETGFESLSFDLDAPIDGVPNVTYDMVRLGLSWDRTLGAPWILASIHFSYLAPVGAGDITEQPGYGRASAWGIDVGGGLTFLPIRWLTLRLEANYTRIGLTFKGTGSHVASSSADQVPSGALLVGFAL